jgi:hypothetical protein
MELLLNLAWVLLAVPAYWLWRRGASARAARKVTALQFLLALGCAVVLLFPVISATDDLHAMRAEMEESAASKRAVRQASSEKHSSWANRLQGPPIAPAIATQIFAPEFRPLEVCFFDFAPRAAHGELHAGRAPPSSFLS